jgi:hypothetical protein
MKVEAGTWFALIVGADRWKIYMTTKIMEWFRCLVVLFDEEGGWKHYRNYFVRVKILS